MPGSSKEEAHKKFVHIENDEKYLHSNKENLKAKNKSGSLLSKRKFSNSLNENKENERSKKRKNIVKKAIVYKTKNSKKQPILNDFKDKIKKIRKRENENSDDNSPNLKRRRRKRKRKNIVELDEASRLQRRTRYLLIKMKLEQNFIDAYSTEGWKGQSREKIKPEKELQNAMKQILKCKLGIREAIRQLDLLSSVGRINDSAVEPDGSVHHEHIICAKCELREAFPDNDIILCDGTCNRAFHQKCLDPPLLTENIPPGDEGWFCKFCKTKIEILEATNAHLGTHFPVDSDWQDIFKEEAALPDGHDSMLHQEEEWPSDDSEDENYDPIEHSCSDGISWSESVASDCSTRFLGSLEDETLGRFEKRSSDNSLDLIGVDSDETNDEVLCCPRQRATVDYIQLYDEMFGKNATENEQISDDEDWGPTQLKRRKVKESDAATTLVTLGETDMNHSKETSSEYKDKLSSEKMKRSIFRLPHNAVEKLRLVFAENELPERAVRVSLSKQLGLEFEKVNKWFKNARYLTLKARKAGREKVYQNLGPRIQKDSTSETAKDDENAAVEIAPKDDDMTSQSNRSSNECTHKTHLPSSSLNMKRRKKPSSQLLKSRSKTTVDHNEDVSLKHLRENASKAKKILNSKKSDCMLEAEAEMERLCRIKSRVEKLQQVLLGLPTRRFGEARKITMNDDSSTIYVPVAKLKEKR